MCGLSSGLVSRGSSPVVMHGLLIVGAFLVGEHRLYSKPASVVAAHGLQRAGSVVVAHGPSCPVYVESFQTRDRTGVPCIGRQILEQWTTREICKCTLSGEIYVTGRPEGPLFFLLSLCMALF